MFTNVVKKIDYIHSISAKSYLRSKNALKQIVVHIKKCRRKFQSNMGKWKLRAHYNYGKGNKQVPSTNKRKLFCYRFVIDSELSKSYYLACEIITCTVDAGITFIFKNTKSFSWSWKHICFQILLSEHMMNQ